jgi:hypothetical protein
MAEGIGVQVEASERIIILTATNILVYTESVLQP